MPTFTLIRAHKRSLSLQVTEKGDLIARAPIFMPKFLIEKFIKQKSVWIEKRRQDLKKPLAKKIRYFTEEKLKEYIGIQLKKYSAIMGLTPSGLRYTTVRSYWGTCAPSGRLSFNLALCFTPPAAVNYVVVHELAHLKWKGHGKKFWELTHKTYPQTNEMRALLRHIKHGTT